MPRNPMASVSALLSYYSFDVTAAEIDSIVKEWLDNYSPKWVIAAVVEAIFQGRYKIASVDTILLNWYLNGQPQHHFDNEFADLVCSKLFKSVPDEPLPVSPAGNPSGNSSVNPSGNSSGNSSANPPAKKQIEMSFVANSASSSSAAPRSAPVSAPGSSPVSLPMAPSIAPPAYALNHVAVVSKTANKGIQRWFRFVTKL